MGAGHLRAFSAGTFEGSSREIRFLIGRYKFWISQAKQCLNSLGDCDNLYLKDNLMEGVMGEIEKNKKHLLELFRKNAFRSGPVILSSGKKSDYYIDAKQITLTPEGMFLIGKVMLDMFKNDEFDAIGGLTVGADPIVVAIGVVSYLEQRPVQTFIVRKEPKKHGMQKFIEGPSLKPNSKVVIVDDVMTSGNSALKAIKAVEDVKCRVVKIAALVDRLEGAREKLACQNYELVSIFTKDDFK